MRRVHFAAFAPHCPRCARAGVGRHPLRLAVVLAEQDGDVRAGVLHCPNPECALEFPIIDGIPVIVPDPRSLLGERAVELLLRNDLDPVLEGLLGDATGPGSWFDVLRQTVSTYGWDGWADLDPAEPAAVADAPLPGAARRCLARLQELAGPVLARRVLDLGCGAGRTSFDLAAGHPEALVLGIDLSFGVLRLAQGALGGRVRYPRRRIGLVYDDRSFAVAPPGAGRVDFWACDAQALPFAPGAADLAVALNLLDCVAEPRRLLAELAAAVRPGGQVLLACPYDWSTRATPMETWIGGHSQRAAHHGAAEPFLHALLTAGAHPQSVTGLALLAETLSWPWQTRLHDRGSVLYRTHLLALARQRSDACFGALAESGHENKPVL
ncbi:MAG TPA: methyltransferase domain-containing protein [Acetobacteraceae bacterium]|nr:methyltransferase domain-containing protein [Acetobacteraceae bacterium]